MTTTIIFLFLSVVATEKIPIPYNIIRDFKGIVPVKIFTANELKDYGGADPTKPIYLALKGVVFDVSTRREFYGKNAVYNRLVGRDSTNAVAKMSLHETDVSKAHDISDLSETQLKDLEEIFHQVYLAKYPIVGFMDYLLSVEEFAKQIKPQDEL
ncbi:neudesin-like [Octopus sinensis]|uniref:Neudesin-like n=1 Tax=Octopus sinensis TaxID=2607531 RepID=A0A6P7SYG7_9MOLL|nr:neudesin-like [Octopus sinensis]